MALEFTIEITDEDLPFFMQAMERAEKRAAGKTAQQILDEASKTFAQSQGQNMPQFVRSRLASVENLVAMAADEGWALAADDRSRVVAALTYFADPEDLIPDNIPVLGFLDDAIMIEVVERLLQPEIEAYADFCAYRSDEASSRGADAGTLGREEWLEGRRAELQARMRQRRGSYAPSGNWTPQFKFS
ncbi:MAG: YkvA family protein [Rudaea sp.]|nr:YkvA family protein [Rudaea sp.]